MMKEHLMNPRQTLAILLLPLALFALGNSASNRITPGADPSLRDRVDALFREYACPDAPGASVIIIKDGKVLYKKAYGMANLEDRARSTTKTNYRIASMTKQFTAMAIMILAERKRVSLDDPLTKFFPDFPPYGKQITVRHLLNHTSGLPDYFDLIPAVMTTPLKDRDVLNLLKRQDRTEFPPGSKFRYCNAGYVLLALIVEEVSGESFPQFLKKNVFDPLRMTRTRFYEREDHGDPNRAYGYSRTEKGFERTDQSLTSSVLGDGSLYSSVEDLYQWDQALYTSRLVSLEMLKQAFTPGAGTGEDAYGFGWFIDNYRGLRDVWHGGNTIGFTSSIYRFPDQRFTVIALTNRNNDLLPVPVHKIIDMCLFSSSAPPNNGMQRTRATAFSLSTLNRRSPLMPGVMPLP
jgi:CubicO group peptidase (beta-lactamase class C family)